MVTCAGHWKKTASEIPTGEEEVTAVMYLQGNETSGGSDGERTEGYVGEPTKGRNELSR